MSVRSCVSHLLLILFLVNIFDTLCMTEDVRTDSTSALISIFKSVDKLLLYFKENYQIASLDTVFGLRVIQGQCRLLIEEYDRGELELSSSGSFTVNFTINEIKRLEKEVGIYANMAVPYLRERDRDYFNVMSKLTIGPWKVFHPHRIVNSYPKWNVELKDNSKFSELESDQCVGELLGGSKSMDKGCQLTKVCLQRMLGLGQSGYQLQRQIFYTIVSHVMGCERHINEYLLALTQFRNVEQLQQELCSRAYYELLDAKSQTMNDADLFAETQFLCPSIGYFQFLKKDWLDSILSWQSEEGCFPLSGERPALDYSLKAKHGEDNEDIRNVYAFEAQKSRPSQKPNPPHVIVNPYLQASAYGYPPQDKHVQGYLDPPSNYKNAHLAVVDSASNQIDTNVGNVAYVGDGNSRVYHQENVVHYPAISNQQNLLLDENYHLGVQRKLHSAPQEPRGANEKWLIHDKIISKGCRSHLTWTVSAALAMYMRYMVDAGPSEFSQLRMEAFKLQPREPSAEKIEPRTSTTAKVDNNTPVPPNFNLMELQAKSYQGIYQRRFSQNYFSTNTGYLSAQTGDVVGYPIRTAKIQRNLTDWVINYVPEKTTLAAKQGTSTTSRKMHGAIIKFERLHKSRMIKPLHEFPPPGERNFVKLHLIAIQSKDSQLDLDRYLVTIVLISLACLVILFRYICYRKIFCKHKGRKSVI